MSRTGGGVRTLDGEILLTSKNDSSRVVKVDAARVITFPLCISELKGRRAAAGPDTTAIKSALERRSTSTCRRHGRRGEIAAE